MDTRESILLSETTLTSATQVSDGVWHKVVWTRIGTNVTMAIDGGTSVTAEANFRVHDNNSNSTITVFMGARPYIPGERSKERCLAS